MSAGKTVYIATRGSALALAQANQVLGLCSGAFPGIRFELKVIKTTGDTLQTRELPKEELSKGLFTKEIELALLGGEAQFAVHSLKDLPTELPEGLVLAGVSPREDARDVLIYRHQGAVNSGELGLGPHATLSNFPEGAVIATSSTRRQAQLLLANPGLKTVPIRGNVGTRVRKLWEQPELGGIILARAGLNRLGFQISETGELLGAEIPSGTLATPLPIEQMLPCPGQAALGYECRANDVETRRIIDRLNDTVTFACVAAERALLRGLGGGCLSPVAACGSLEGDKLRLRGVYFENGEARRVDLTGKIDQHEELGLEASRILKG